MGVGIMSKQDCLCLQQHVNIKAAELPGECHSTCFKDLSVGCKQQGNLFFSFADVSHIRIICHCLILKITCNLTQQKFLPQIKLNILSRNYFYEQATSSRNNTKFLTNIRLRKGSETMSKREGGEEKTQQLPLLCNLFFWK